MDPPGWRDGPGRRLGRRARQTREGAGGRTAARPLRTRVVYLVQLSGHRHAALGGGGGDDVLDVLRGAVGQRQGVVGGEDLVDLRRWRAAASDLPSATQPSYEPRTKSVRQLQLAAAQEAARLAGGQEVAARAHPRASRRA